MRIDVMGVGFDSLTMDEAVARARDLMAERRAAYVVTPNPEIVMLCREDPAAMQAVQGADLVLPDGIGVIYGAKILGTPLRAKLPGIDFASALMAQMGQEGKSVFLLGAKPGVADAAAEKMRARFPGLVIAGTNDGYFQDDDPVVEKINAAHPDLLLVCLGAPKQELWMQRNAPRLRVGLMAGLGGSLDVFAGNVKRAPKFFQKLGLEWFYRLLKEPKRIGRMMKLPKFLFAAIGCKLWGRNAMAKGKLIVLEGIDGSGKSAQYRRLCARFDEMGMAYHHIVFPRYDQESSALIRMYLNGAFGAHPSDVNAYAASTFFAVDRYASYRTDWGEIYENGGLILSDRYTTSNAIHQGSKLPEAELPAFFDWLYDLEYGKMGLPRPDLVLYLDVDLPTSLKRMQHRQEKHNTKADIHEQDVAYLENCLRIGRLAAAHYGWTVVPFMKDGAERELEEKHEEIFSIIRSAL